MLQNSSVKLNACCVVDRPGSLQRTKYESSTINHILLPGTGALSATGRSLPPLSFNALLITLAGGNSSALGGATILLPPATLHAAASSSSVSDTRGACRTTV
jgi:hypothetical protein